MLRLLIRFLRWFWFSDESEEHHALRVRCEALGFALPRTIAETATDRRRIAERKRRHVVWRRPCPNDHAAYDALVNLFADALFVVASIDGETWIMGNRLFSGFPDPPTYMVIFLGSAHQVIAAAEIDHLPSRWTMPPDLLAP